MILLLLLLLTWLDLAATTDRRLLVRHVVFINFVLMDVRFFFQTRNILYRGTCPFIAYQAYELQVFVIMIYDTHSISFPMHAVDGPVASVSCTSTIIYKTQT